MIILALDLSTRSSGYAIGTDNILEKHGFISASNTNPIKRIIKMRDQLAKIIKTYNIKKIIMEQVRPEYNSHTMKILMWLQAAIAIAAYEIDPQIQCEFIGASSWRAQLKIKQGRGIKRNQLKPQDIQYVKNKYNIQVNDDEADAICIFDAYWLKQQDFNWK